MPSRHLHKNPIYRARKRVIHNVLIVVLFGSLFCLLIEYIVFFGMEAFEVSTHSNTRPGIGINVPIISALMLTIVGFYLFFKELLRSRREYRQIYRRQMGEEPHSDQKINKT
jgi:hypothetical protein